jgi:cytochrome c peroxidase
MTKVSRVVVCALLLMMVAAAGTASAAGLTVKQNLGMMLFMDNSLSGPGTQSCMSCHHPLAGFADPGNLKDPAMNVVSVGADGHSVGGRNAPSAAYMAYSPGFQWSVADEMYIGGQFWDGRAIDLAAQAKGPFVNMLEMANTKRGVVEAVRDAPYKSLFLKVFGKQSLDDLDDIEKVEKAYGQVAEAIADFEGTTILNQFSSKYDHYLAGKVRLTKKELKGFQLFNDPAKGNCAACHPSDPGPYNAKHALFTDFSYDNLGIPKSMNPDLINNPVDYGLGARQDLISQSNENNPPPCNTDSFPSGTVTCTAPDGKVVLINDAGKFKVPTLRNLSRTAPYGHNGYFATLKEIVHFYNTAGTPGMWPDPEVGMNVNRDELGALGLSGDEEDAIVAFLQTLTDGYPLLR